MAHSSRREPRIFCYKMIFKKHGAPTIQPDKHNKLILSLTLCKPQIRTQAKVGDIIFGFGSKKSKNNGELVYACKVTEVVEAPYYYVLSQYHYRRDCSYRIIDNKVYWRAGFLGYQPIFSSVDDIKETVFPHNVNIGKDYKKSKVLLSTNFRSFYKDGSSKELMEIFPLIRDYISKRGRGTSFPMIREPLQQLWSILQDFPPNYEEDI